MKIHLFLLMAGKGERVRELSQSGPKALIQVKEKKLFEYALSALEPIKNELEIWSVIRQCDQVYFSSYDDQLKLLPIKETSGPAESVYEAVKKLRYHGPMIILDCDLLFECKKYVDFILSPLHVDFAFPTFFSEDSKYSFAQTTSEGKVLAIAEKKVISEEAIAGCYYLRSSDLFVEHFHSLVIAKENKNGEEIYISHVMNNILKEGGIGVSFKSEKHLSLGTTQEIKDYLNDRK